MALATDAGKQAESPLPMGAAAEAFYAAVTKEVPEFARKDFSVVYEYLRRRQS